MKYKIRFMILLFALIAPLMFSCNQLRNRGPNRKEFLLKYARLRDTLEKIDLKTRSAYDSISFLLERYDSLAGAYKELIFNVELRKDEMVDFIEGIKRTLISSVEGKGSPAISGSEINAAAITRLNNSKIPSDLLIGKEMAISIKVLLEDYKLFLQEVVKNDSIITKNIEIVLNTDDPQKKTTGKNNKEYEMWELYTFKGKPLGSVLLILTQIQNNVRNTESEVLSFLQSEMKAKIKLNN